MTSCRTAALVAAGLAIGLSSAAAQAAEPAACRDVVFSDVGWTDITLSLIHI